jgi:multidrug resistance efflux pump
MGWRLEHALATWGPRALLLLSALALLPLLRFASGGVVPAFVEVAPISVGSLETARVLAVHVRPGMLVAAGTVLAELDPSAIDAKIRVLRAERQREERDASESTFDRESALREAEADALDTELQLSAAQAELALRRDAVAARAERVRVGLETADTEADADVAALVVEQERLAAELAGRRQHRDSVRAWLAAGGVATSPAAIAIDEEITALLEEKRELTLRAPVDGRIATVWKRPGAVLRAGEPLLDLLPARGTDVIACLPERFPQEVPVGASASLLPATGGAAREGVVTDVLGLVDEAPERCRTRPDEFGWMRAVRIAVFGDALTPGARFSVRFGAPAVPSTRPSEPAAASAQGGPPESVPATP